MPDLAVAERLAAAIDAASAASPKLADVCEMLLADVSGLCVAARNLDYIASTKAALDPGGPCTAIGHAGGFDPAGAAIVNGTAGTINLPAYQDTDVDNRHASFSSQGPTDVTFRVQPDLMAPGDSIISSVPGDCGAGGCWGFNSGTSMATPHLAGAAAVVRAARPAWTAEQVRSAIVNTARRDVITTPDGSELQTDVNVIGAGLLDVDAAVNAVAAIAPVSTSFGAVPANSGQTRTAAVTLSNLSGQARSWQLAVTDTTGSGVSFSLSRNSVALTAGASTVVTVTMTAAKGADLADHQALLRVTEAGTPVAHSVLYVFVK